MLLMQLLKLFLLLELSGFCCRQSEIIPVAGGSTTTKTILVAVGNTTGDNFVVGNTTIVLAADKIAHAIVSLVAGGGSDGTKQC